jgi:ribosome-associated protein
MTLDSRQKALEIARLADARGALDLVVLHMREVMTITDYFIICHGRSKVHCQAVAEHITKQMRQQGAPLKHSEGLRDGVWIILDYLDVVVHIFEEEARLFYDLRRLWMDAEEIEVSPPA